MVMDLNEGIIGRRSVREYTEQPVDERVIQRLLHAAVQAPSAATRSIGCDQDLEHCALQNCVSNRVGKAYCHTFHV